MNAPAGHVVIPASAEHRPRWGGLVVPYTTERASHGPILWPRIETAEYGLVSSCTCQDGQGVPRFTEVCRARHRIAVTNRLCQTCGTRVPDDGMFFLGGYLSLVFRAAPQHEDCCRYSLQVCKGLNDSMPRDRLYVAAAVGYKVLLQISEVEQFVCPEERHLCPGLVTEWYARPAITSYTRARDWLGARI